MPYTEFRGSQTVSETINEYEDGLLVRSVTTAEPRWTELDRGLVLALLEERAETCPECRHPMSVCRDKKTAGRWEVVQATCWPTQVAQAVAGNNAKDGKRGVVLSTRLNP